MYWIEFFISASVTVFAGIHLTQNADYLSDRLHLGKAWIGVALLGLVTSLPEAVTSLIAVVSLDAANLAVGNLMGSNVFNPMMIVLMDIIYRQGSITNSIISRESHKATMAFAVLMTLLAALEILFGVNYAGGRILGFSTAGILIILLYFLGMKIIATLSAKEHLEDEAILPAPPERSLKSIVIGLLASALGVIVAAIWLTNSCDAIALNTGLGRTFVGSVFLAIVTSLPELVVTISALRLGSVDLAIGNIFGSNMANMLILVICGLFYPGTSMLYDASKTHLFTACLSISLICVAGRGIFHKNSKTFAGIGLDSWMMLYFFFVGLGFLFKLR